MNNVMSVVSQLVEDAGRQYTEDMNKDEAIFNEMIKNDINHQVKTLDTVNAHISELTRIKKVLEERIVEALDHDEPEKQSTYNVGSYKVVVKTGINYKVDAGEYEVYKRRLNSEFDPIRIKTEYTLDKKILKEAEKYGSHNDLDTLSKFIVKKPAKPSVTLKDNV